MSRMKALLFEDEKFETIDSIATLLNGEVDGRYILCASPGRPPEDRSCCVRINPSRPDGFFIYYCEGSQGQAYANIRLLLGIAARPRPDSRLELVRRIWSECSEPKGSAVETYLRSRGITLDLPAALKFHSGLKHQPSGSIWPAMVAAVTDRNGNLCAIHRTYLAWGGRSKAPIDPEKMTLGSILGGAVRLSAVQPSIVLAEGIETALSVTQATQLPTWAALSTGGLKAILLPQCVRHVVIAADGDRYGEQAARLAARRFILQGRTVAVARAPTGKDFNDVLRSEMHP